MDIGEIISDSLRYPSTDWTKVIILGVILVASILIVPVFLVSGYMFRIIKATLAGLDELPDFDDWGEMFIDGLKVFAVAIVYAIPVWILLFAMGAGMDYIAAFLDPNMFWALLAIIIIVEIIAVIIGLVEYFAIANMAYYNGELGAAFRFSEILDHIARVGWGKYLVTYILIAIITMVAIFVGALTMIILIGFIFLPLFIAPYMVMFSARALGLLFASSEE